jgi:hypothetical protein
MPGTQADLTALFNTLMQAFNSRDVDTIANNMANNATVYSIKPHQHYSPKHAALAFLQQQFADNPHFEPAGPANYSLNAAQTGAIITGNAAWVDSENLAGETIQYSFTFVYDDLGDGEGLRWLISSVWAS